LTLVLFRLASEKLHNFLVVFFAKSQKVAQREFEGTL
jgi:hypothetical protein